MTRNNGSRRAGPVPVVIVGLVLSSGVLAAAQSSEEITVVAPRLVQKEVVGASPSGAVKTELISLTRRVGYSDLDLAQPANFAALEQRIRDTAKEACEQLEKMYPMAQTTPRSCIDQAVEEAMSQVNALKP